MLIPQKRQQKKFLIPKICPRKICYHAKMFLRGAGKQFKTS